MKEKLLSALGNFGLVLYYIIRLFVSILPLVMIDANFVLTFLYIADNYAFWENHACVVPIGSSTYHVFPNCPRCDTSSFYIYNTEQAENLGYSICPLCDIMN